MRDCEAEIHSLWLGHLCRDGGGVVPSGGTSAVGMRSHQQVNVGNALAFEILKGARAGLASVNQYCRLLRGEDEDGVPLANIDKVNL